MYRIVQNDVSILLSLSFHIKLTQASVFQIDRAPKFWFPASMGQGARYSRAEEDRDCRGLFRHEISSSNSKTVSEGLSRQKRSNQTPIKAPPGQDNIILKQRWPRIRSAAVDSGRRSQKFVEKLTRIWSPFLFSSVAGVCVVFMNVMLNYKQA